MYSWTVWFHIISMVSWFAVLFYLPRLFVYHQENSANEGFLEVVKVMEMKIYKYIGIPAFWATTISGAYLIYLNPSVFSQGGWMHAKLTFVLLLAIYFFSLGKFREKLLGNTCNKSGKFFRFYNEIPTILLMLIVAMVIVKPF
ncbi:MAG: protoporphyrinogen oxidase HemJ [Campylobacterota bacterium]|nr:protoporphyrinogen oxidase HemJ [Campylobacterota bacterium]